MEERILRYYLGLFSLIVFFYFFYFLTIKNFFKDDLILNIDKGESISQISSNFNINLNFYEKKFIKYIFIIKNYHKPINYGKFNIKRNINLLNILEIITSKSNLDYKITIIEGWQKYNLNEYLKDFYNMNIFINYDKILADTYYINSSNDLNAYKKFAYSFLDNFFYRL